jgi:ankyrin repeat protein
MTNIWKKLFGDKEGKLNEEINQFKRVFNNGATTARDVSKQVEILNHLSENLAHGGDTAIKLAKALSGAEMAYIFNIAFNKFPSDGRSMIDSIVQGIDHQQLDSMLNNLLKERPDALNYFLDNVEDQNLIKGFDLISREKSQEGDINAKDNDGQTALMRAALTDQTEIVKLLLDNGVNVDVKSDVGWTALMFAADKGFTNIVKLILQTGADINAQDNDGYTALMGAAFSGRTEVVKLLLENDADMNAKATDEESRGTTALMSAAYNGYTEIVKLLTSKGADLTAENMYGYTALKSASSKGHTEIVEILKKAGVKK